MTFEEWLRVGVNSKFCSEPVCATHDGLPWTEEELEDDLDDPCVPGVRLWPPV